MLTASPATGAADPVAEAEVPAGASGIAGIPLMPGIPGVVAPDPKVTDGAVCDGGDEDIRPAAPPPTAQHARPDVVRA